MVTVLIVWSQCSVPTRLRMRRSTALAYVRCMIDKQGVQAAAILEEK